ncbi:MAG: hypothetical protein JWM19_5834 [Actinomycetia bacterium]|jgi:hypothetical protein|nr:hypothetical protein [Actinomycetes bacterium]
MTVAIVSKRPRSRVRWGAQDVIASRPVFGPDVWHADYE